VVNVKAKAGYANGYADPEYIKVLPTFQLPFLSREKKYRTFQISGDSMLPIPDGSWVTGEFIQNWNLIKTGHPAIVLTLDEGVVFKIVENNIKTEGKIKLHSLNPLYDSYEVEVGQIRELWKFVNFISSQIPEGNNPKDELINEIKQLRKEVRVIQTKLSL
jgi:phage repressor protein C with HTH and peptisase S24 domain